MQGFIVRLWFPHAVFPHVACLNCFWFILSVNWYYMGGDVIILLLTLGINRSYKGGAVLILLLILGTDRYYIGSAVYILMLTLAINKYCKKFVVMYESIA